jgi:acetyl esterase/lipase
MIDHVAKKKARLAFVAEQPCLMEEVQYGLAGDYPLMATLYKPKNKSAKPAPAIVYIHGGGFTGGERDQFEANAAYFTNHGYVGLCISYRLAPQDKFPAQVQDAKCAVRWLRANASQLNIDIERIGVCGASAGGSISALTAYAQGVPEFADQGGNSGFSEQIQAAIFQCGIYDFMPRTMPFGILDSVKKSYLGGKYEEIPQKYKKASPIEYVNKTSPPTLLFHGDADETVNVKHAYLLSEKLKANGVYHELYIAEGGSHSAYIFLMPHFMIALKQMETFLLKTFK